MDENSGDHFGSVVPAFGTYKSQSLALNALLKFHSIIDRDDYWIVPRRTIEGLLHKAPGVTPSYYYRWPDDSMPPMPVSFKATRIDENETVPGRWANESEAFVAHLCKQFNLPNSIVRIVLRALAAEAPKWMVANRMALNLGFVKLVAVPFRVNWKEIVAYKMKRHKLQGLLALPRSERGEALENAGVPGVLCSPDNVGLHKGSNYKIEYTIEARPLKSFDSVAGVIESQRLACGTTSYVASFEKTVEKHYHDLLDILERYLKKTNAAYARVSERGNAGVLRFLPTRADKIKVRGVNPRQLPVSIVPDDRSFSVFAEEEKPKPVQAKDKSVLSLPAVPPAIEDVRKCEEQ